MNLEDVKSLVAADMEAVNRAIQGQMQSAVPTIPALGSYLIASGGKRLRPMVLLLATRLFGYQGSRHIPLAAVIEFIHTSTLLHDDVVDGSEMRRNQATANQVWGNAASVLVGDFLYARSFEVLVADGDLRILKILAEATSVIAEGEVQQLENTQNPDLDEAAYIAVIRAKTAKLFEASARIGAVINERPPAEELALAEYGGLLGTAFQLIDDALDYSAESATLGKNVGDDLAEGKPTMPFIHAMRESDPAGQAVLRQALAEEGLGSLDQVLEIIASTKAIEYTLGLARKIAGQAKSTLDILPAGPQRDALAYLADFSVERQF
ncbi:polyprenyl synthetase family protein [Thermithiobacillus plumbiphilus]|uniref:Polyprenyl synthetase family protein n=1 Tax=Thermithiobacillus plumbiphilus TaxID=1729899 RepID=A0ABU9DBV7_9PROT